MRSPISRVEVGEVGQHLAQVVMVRLLELVLDDDLAPEPVIAVEIEAEGADPLLALLDAHLEVEDVVEVIDVVLQPDGEIAVLPLPDFPQRHSLDLPDVHVVKIAPPAPGIYQSV